MNWLLALKRININIPLLIFSLDTESEEFLNKNGVDTERVPGVNNISQLWVRRVEIFKDLLDSGLNIIHSDLDALWLRNPMHYFENGNYDFLFSQGTTHPQEIFKKREFVLTCGFFGIRSNPKTIQVLDKIRKDVQLTKDDQTSFNRILLDNHLKINKKWNMSYFLESGGKSLRPRLGR